MKKTRITKGEIHEAMRHEGYANEDDVLDLILERNGEVSVVPRQDREVHPSHKQYEALRREGAR